MEYATLNSGVKMPMAGIGTFLLTPDEAENSVAHALKDGYRLIDTANAYVNEKAVGRAIRKSGVDRSEIFLETKLWPSFYEQEDAVDKTLERLDTDYIDLLLIHQPAGNYVAGYRLMEKAYKEGKVKAKFPSGSERWLDDFDTLVIAVGYRAENALAAELEEMGCPCVRVGDCASVGKILTAIESGFQAGCSIK